MLRVLADDSLPWEKVHVVSSRRRVAPAAIRTNLAHLRESLLEHASLRADHVHAMPVEARGPQRAAGQYTLTLREVQGRRRCSTSFISASVRTATPHRWCRRSGPRRHRRDVATPAPTRAGRRMTLTFPSSTVAARAVAGDRGGECWNAGRCATSIHPFRRHAYARIGTDLAVGGGSGGSTNRHWRTEMTAIARATVGSQ